MKMLLFAVASLALLLVVGILVFVYVVQDVETPNYAVVETDRHFEIRDYPTLIVAEVKRSGARREALSTGFRPLARYIFAKERGGDTIAMTAPVIQQAEGARREAQPIAMTAPVLQQSLPSTSSTTEVSGSEKRSGLEEEAWVIGFIMPSASSIEQLPVPAGDEVRLSEIPARRLAAIRFSGSTPDAVLFERERELRAWLNERGLGGSGAAIFAYYNDPFTPGFLRRNEVLLEIDAAQARPVSAP